ncbi:MAG: sigma-54-dependent Fis family transcriptional regulator [Flavobacteriaceae bacterium]|nr:sigma-54-dependent Fis family transcriptional regulator [Flavobacteriaceae bacterium]
MDKIKIKLLIVDDEKDIRDSLKDILIDEGYEVYLAANALEAKKIKLSKTFDLILLDIWMPDIDGLTLLKEWALNNEINCPVIMMSGHGTIDTAVEATKIGATDFLEKPISLQKLLKTITSTLKNSVELKKIDKTFFEECNLKFVKDIEADINNLKTIDLVAFVSNRTNFIEIFISMVFSTNYYLVKKASEINNNLLNLIQTSGLKFILFENCLDGTVKYKDCERLFNELIAKKIKIIFLEKDKNSFDRFFKNENDISIIESPKISKDRDLIPDLSNALLTFHLNKNPNISFKILDISALKTLRNKAGIESLDQLDKIIVSLIKISDTELIDKDNVDNYFNQHNSPIDQNSNNEMKIDFLYEKPLKESRDLFETMYLKHHLSQNKSITELSKKTGIERTHLYRKLKQLGIKV